MHQPLPQCIILASTMMHSRSDTSSLDHLKMYLTHSYPLLKNKLEIAKKNAFNGLGCIISPGWVTELSKDLPIPSDHDDLENFLIMNSKELITNYKIPRPKFIKDCQVKVRLDSIQQYLNSLGYCFLQTTFFDIKKKRSLRTLMRTAQEIISYGLPIKCLEALLVSVFLSSSIKGLDRIPVAFKSEFKKNEYRHIVLVCRSNSSWGALGLSRKSDLMYKPLIFKSLMDLVKNYIDAYHKYGHKVLKIKIGLPIQSDVISNEGITWKFVSIDTALGDVHYNNWNSSSVYLEIENYIKKVRMMSSH